MCNKYSFLLSISNFRVWSTDNTEALIIYKLTLDFLKERFTVFIHLLEHEFFIFFRNIW